MDLTMVGILEVGATGESDRPEVVARVRREGGCDSGAVFLKYDSFCASFVISKPDMVFESGLMRQTLRRSFTE